MELQIIKEQLDRIENAILSQKAVLNFDEAVKFTGMSKSYMYKLTSAHKIPHYKPFGKMVYFNLDELQAWLLQNRISTHDELESKAQAYCLNNPIGRIIKSDKKKHEKKNVIGNDNNINLHRQKDKIRGKKNEGRNNELVFRFGRYKDKRIDICLDLNYLIWFYKNIHLDDSTSYAIEHRIEELQSNK